MAHPSFWTEDAFLVLQASKDRIELWDGGLHVDHGLWVNPSPNNAHNQIAWLLANQLSAATRFTGLKTVQGPNLQLTPSLILTPDVAVGRFTRAAAVNRGPEATLVADVASPGISAAARAPFYAEARIDWYLLAEPDFATYTTVTLHLLHREGTAYLRHTTAQFGQTLTSRQPFPLTVSTTALLDF
jgi:Uma2 family endonuclease